MLRATYSAENVDTYTKLRHTFMHLVKGQIQENSGVFLTYIFIPKLMFMVRPSAGKMPGPG